VRSLYHDENNGMIFWDELQGGKSNFHAKTTANIVHELDDLEGDIKP
jgi:hypothetical protein